MAGQRVLVIDDSPTITKVVQLVLTKAGFTVATAADGAAGLAAVRAERPDVILLDFVMPRMNGYQFCRELNADSKLRDIPVVLMSAKGDQGGEQFVKVMGIVDYITKPFSPEAITAVVQHTLDKHGADAPPEDATVSQVTGEDLASEDRAHARSTALAQLRSSIIEALASRVASTEATGRSAHTEPTETAVDVMTAGGAAAITEAARTALDDATLTRLLAAVDVALIGDTAPDLRGDLRVVPLAELLHLLGAQQQSGQLTVEARRARIDVYFRRGKLDQVIGSGVADELVLGRFVIDAELMPRTVLDDVLAARPAPPGLPLLGQQLIERGHLTDADLRACLTRQSSELLYEALRWRRGRFRFIAGVALPPHVTDAALGLDVEAILMEGYRRVDEWHLIERAIDNFDIVFLRNEEAIAHLGRGRLTRDELAVLELVDGRRTVQQIVRASRLRSFEVSKMLYRLLSIKLLRRRMQPVAV